MSFLCEYYKTANGSPTVSWTSTHSSIDDAVSDFKRQLKRIGIVLNEKSKQKNGDQVSIHCEDEKMIKITRVH